MKVTVEIPEQLVRQAKALSALRGVPLRQLVSEALEARVTARNFDQAVGEASPPWMAGFGGLRHLHEENMRIDKLIEEEFGQIEKAS